MHSFVIVAIVGAAVIVGETVGTELGADVTVGYGDGDGDGGWEIVGSAVGTCETEGAGVNVGLKLGKPVGSRVKDGTGETLTLEGSGVGCEVGTIVGTLVPGTLTKNPGLKAARLSPYTDLQESNSRVQ